MSVRIGIAAGSFALALSASLAAADCTDLNASAPDVDWTLYHNERFGTVLCVPTTLFEALPPPANADGRAFASIPDGRSELLVWGSHNVLVEDLRQLEAQARASRQTARITYAARGKRWFVLSGHLGEEIFYERHHVTPDREVIHSFAITYPTSQRHIFDRVVEGLTASFASESLPLSDPSRMAPHL